MSPTCVVVRWSVSALVSLAAAALATVISSPSRIHATPRAMTIRVWNGDHGSRSIRAGMRLRMAPGAGADASWVVVIERLRAGADLGKVPVPSSLQLRRSTVLSPNGGRWRRPPRSFARGTSHGWAHRIAGGGHDRDHAPARAPWSPERGPRRRPDHPHHAVRDDH